jgi:ABC-type Fe3+ transport system permease subunit
VTVRRITGPALRPAAVRLMAASFAAGLVTVGAVAGLLGPSGPGATLLLGLAASGATGAACAVASTLVALATAALRLGRIAAGGERLPTPLG